MKTLCENCEPKYKDMNPLFSDTGKCMKCGEVNDCFDEELVELYSGLGVDAEFVWRHLPRLRNPNFENSESMTLKDIGVEISRHAIFGGCEQKGGPCQGYGIDKRQTMIFKKLKTA